MKLEVESQSVCNWVICDCVMRASERMGSREVGASTFVLSTLVRYRLLQCITYCYGRLPSPATKLAGTAPDRGTLVLRGEHVHSIPSLASETMKSGSERPATTRPARHAIDTRMALTSDSSFSETSRFFSRLMMRRS